MVNKAERSPGSQSQEPALSQQELYPKVKELFNGWRQALMASDKFRENLAQRYLSGEAHMRDYEPEGRQRLRVILDDSAENRWIRYSIGSEEDSAMEILEVFAIVKDEVFRQEGVKKKKLEWKMLELRRAWKTFPGDRGEGKTHISYEYNLMGKPEIKETNTQAALNYGQKLLDYFQVSLSSSTTK